MGFETSSPTKGESRFFSIGYTEGANCWQQRLTGWLVRYNKYHKNHNNIICKAIAAEDIHHPRRCHHNIPWYCTVKVVICERMTANDLLKDISEWIDHTTGISGSLGVSHKRSKWMNESRMWISVMKAKQNISKTDDCGESHVNNFFFSTLSFSS